MKKLIIICFLLITFMHQSCNLNNKVDSDNYIGTWKPMPGITNYPTFSIIQIEKHGNLYIMGAKPEYSYAELEFYVCQDKKDHLSVNIFNTKLSTANTINIYVERRKDIDFRYLYFQGIIYIPSNEKLFKISSSSVLSIEE